MPEKRVRGRRAKAARRAIAERSTGRVIAGCGARGRAVVRPKVKPVPVRPASPAGVITGERKRERVIRRRVPGVSGARAVREIANVLPDKVKRVPCAVIAESRSVPAAATVSGARGAAPGKAFARPGASRIALLPTVWAAKPVTAVANGTAVPEARPTVLI